jgi:hypothetical protein
MTNFTHLSNTELSEAISFHRRQRNMSRGVNESAHARQTQVVRLLEAEEARRLDEVADKKWDESKEKWVSVKRPTFDPKKERGRASTPDQGQKRSDFDEEAEQIDELSKQKLRSYSIANEKDREDLSLKKIGWIKGSPTADQQKHIDKLKKRVKGDNLASTKMYPNVHKNQAWAAKVPATEEVELDEGHYHVSWGGPSLSHTVMNAKSADHAVASAKAHLIKKIPKLADEKYSDTFDKKPRVTNITNEEVEQIDELSKKTLGSYVRKSAIDAYRKGQDVEYHNAARDATDNYGAKRSNAEKIDKARLKASNRITGIEKATRQLTKEEVDQIDELSKTTLGSYIKRAANERGHAGIEAGTAISKGGDLNSHLKTMKKRLDGVRMATNKLTKEELELNESLVKPKVHDLSHMSDDGEVYDHTQTHDKINDGDVLKLSRGRAGVMVSAWPVVTHGDSDTLHKVSKGKHISTIDNGRYKASHEAASKIAKAKETVNEETLVKIK